MLMTPGGTSSLSDRVPVEQVLMFPSATVALSTSGPILRVWDLVAGGVCTRALSNHQKTVTALAFNSTGDRLLTGSLDQMVKVYDVSTYKVVHTMRYPAPVLCLSISVRKYAVTVVIRSDLFISLTIRISSEACPMVHYPSAGEIPKPLRSTRNKLTPMYRLSCQILLLGTVFYNKRLSRKALRTRANYAWRRKHQRNWKNTTNISKTSNILLLSIQFWRRFFHLSQFWYIHLIKSIECTADNYILAHSRVDPSRWTEDSLSGTWRCPFGTYPAASAQICCRSSLWGARGWYNMHCSRFVTFSTSELLLMYHIELKACTVQLSDKLP